MNDLQRAILEFLALSAGEGSVLARDVAVEVGVLGRSMGFRLRRLEELGWVERVVVKPRASVNVDTLYGWMVTNLGLQQIGERG